MKVRWARRANLDLDSAFQFIKEHNPRAAISTVRRIDAAVKRLTERPRVGRLGKIDGTNELVILRTPYIIVYIVASDEVLIARILHGRQQWPARIEDG